MNGAPNAGAPKNGYQNGLDTKKDNLFPCAPQPSPLFAVASITSSHGGQFRHGGNEPAVIVPVRDRFGRICDSLAYREAEPGKWWLREGDQTPILGARELAGATMVPGPIPLHPTPAAWVAASGCGACVIDWDAPLFDLFRNVDIDLRHLPGDVQRALRERLWRNFRRDIPGILWKGVRHAA